MDPYQNSGAPSGNPYEFIMSPGQPARPKRFGFGRGNFAFTIAFIVGGAVLLMVVLAIIINIVAPGTPVSKASLISLSQTQNELIRVADQGAKSGVQQVTKNLAVTIGFAMTTEQQQTLKYLAAHGTDVDKKELALKQNATTDQQLTTAKTTSTFDLAFSQIMQTQLTSYANDVKRLHDAAASKTERDMMSTFYRDTQLLISQIPYAQAKINTVGQ